MGEPFNNDRWTGRAGMTLHASFHAETSWTYLVASPPAAPPPPMVPSISVPTGWDGPFAYQYLSGYCSPFVSAPTFDEAVAKVMVTPGCRGVTQEPFNNDRWTGRAGTILHGS